jgi:hypothetical protein
MAVWFMPAPIAATTPWARSSSRVGAVQDFSTVLVRIVEIHDVHRVHAESFKALLERPDDAVAAEVPNALVGCGHVESFIVELPREDHRLESPTHFGRQDVLVSRSFSESRAEATFGKPESVVWRGVKVPDALVPCGVDRCTSIVVRYCRIEIPELRASQRYLGQ